MNWEMFSIGCVGCGLLWVNRYKVACIANSYYCKINDWYMHNPYTVNRFKNMSCVSISHETTDMILYTYSFRNTTYVILSNSEDFNGVPYEISEIDSIQSNTEISMLTNSPNDIICSEIELSDGKKIDGIEYAKMLSGPLGNFYKNTYCEVTNRTVRAYLKYVLNQDDIKSMTYMLCNGEEYDLLK